MEKDIYHASNNPSGARMPILILDKIESKIKKYYYRQWGTFYSDQKGHKEYLTIISTHI